MFEVMTDAGFVRLIKRREGESHYSLMANFMGNDMETLNDANKIARILNENWTTIEGPPDEVEKKCIVPGEDDVPAQAKQYEEGDILRASGHGYEPGT